MGRRRKFHKKNQWQQDRWNQGNQGGHGDEMNPGNQQGQGNRQQAQGRNERNYTQTTKENELFKEYYSGLGVMEENEVEDFYNRMKEPLPVTFRITGYKSQAKELLRIIRSKFFDKMIGASASATSTATSSDSNATTSNSAATSSDTAAASLNTAAADSVTPSADSANVSAVADGASVSAGDADDKDVSGDKNSDDKSSGWKPAGEGGWGDGVLSTEKATEEKEAVKEPIKPPKCLTWYPDELAWQLNLSRKMVRSQDTLSKLHEFLVTETETGNISRQEAVSMIPPLLLDIQPHSKVLDMCAAPGSKTAQLIEYLHKDENAVPEGFVMANDRENKRCYLMVHQVKRLSSPCCVIVNHDATMFPKLRTNSDDEKPEFMLFDRVLADVPCSGDGTMRKNIDIWSKWQPTMGNSMHGLQLKILKRGLELLEVGGRLVYSTCSMQPVEDEAVIAEMLRKCAGAVELVDSSSLLPGFKTVPGLSKWRLMNKQGSWLTDFDSIPAHFRQQFTPSMFPPTEEEAKKLNLHLCHRILPHHQDTGGFFVASLQKVRHLPWSKEARTEREAAAKARQAEAEIAGTGASAENGADTSAPPEKGVADSTTIDNSRKRKGETEEGPQPKKKDKKLGFKEDPFLFLQPDDSIWPPIRDFYGLSDQFPMEQLLYRSEKGAKRSLYFVSKVIRDIVTNNEYRVHFVNMGVKFVSRSPSPLVPDCDFRITQELVLPSKKGKKVGVEEEDGRFRVASATAVALPPHWLSHAHEISKCMGSLRDVFGKRTLYISKEDAVTIIKEENPYIDKMCLASQEALENTSPGSVVFVYKPTESNAEPACEVTFCGWRGKTTVRSFIPRHERSHCLRLFGYDLTEITDQVAQKKAERKKQELAAATESDPPSTENEKETTGVSAEKTSGGQEEGEEELEGDPDKKEAGLGEGQETEGAGPERQEEEMKE